ncbi:MAG: ABC transporter permease [Candidatus Fimivivens sp.]|nr:ABC transporter permease [Candidatus Fimivivens sp.]
MKRYLLQKCLSLLPVLFGISLAAFVLGVVTPGNPAELALSAGGYTPTPEQIAAMETQMGLDQPYLVQYVRWVGQALCGNLGISYASGNPVAQELLTRLPITLRLTACAIVITCLFGIALGCGAAAFRDGAIDRIVRFGINVSLSLPGFWFALLMILFFSELLGWLPTSGNGNLRHMIMPTTVLSVAPCATAARLTRATLLSEAGKPYYSAAVCRGVGRWGQVVRNALPNVIPPVSAMLGNSLGGMLGGSVIVETIFALPGIGSYALDAIHARDYPALQGYVLLTGFIFVMITLLVDIISMLSDPRVRVGRSRI